MNRVRFKYVNRLLLGLGIAVELLASALTVLSAPFDLYPVSVRTFLIEHAVLWTLVFGVLNLSASRIFRLSSQIQTAVSCLIAELVATCCAWFVLPGDISHISEVNQIWFGESGDYFLRRLIIWFLAAILALVVYRFTSWAKRGTSVSA